MKTTRNKLCAQPLPKDGLHEYMCIAPNFWGRHEAAAVAVTNCRLHGAGPEDMKKARLVIVPKGAVLEPVSGQWMEWPSGKGKHPEAACEHCTFQLPRQS